MQMPQNIKRRKISFIPSYTDNKYGFDPREIQKVAFTWKKGSRNIVGIDCVPNHRNPHLQPKEWKLH